MHKQIAGVGQDSHGASAKRLFTELNMTSKKNTFSHYVAEHKHLNGSFFTWQLLDIAIVFVYTLKAHFL